MSRLHEKQPKNVSPTGKIRKSVTNQILRYNIIKSLYLELYGHSYYVSTPKNGISSVHCRKHNRKFNISIDTIRSPKGCPICTGCTKTKTFIRKSKELHGDSYTYSHCDISSNKVTLGCKKHGLFNISKDLHLKGYGCPECGGSPKLYLMTDGTYYKIGVSVDVSRRWWQIQCQLPDKEVTVIYSKYFHDAKIREQKILSNTYYKPYINKGFGGCTEWISLNIAELEEVSSYFK